MRWSKGVGRKVNVILDTNVFISGIFWKGNYCSQIIDRWVKKEINLVVSTDIVEELIDVLSDFKIKLSENMIENWKEKIINNSIVVEPNMNLQVVKDDPDDNKFIEAAIEGDCDYIVSQDKHLLNVGTYKDIKIIMPKEFLQL